MPKYRKKPLVIEALQLRWDNWSEMCEFAHVGAGENDNHGEFGKPDKDGNPTCTLHIFTLEGCMIANQGDYIIRGIAGEFYPCKPEIFEASYELVGDDK